MLHCYLHNPEKEMSNNDILSSEEKKELLEIYNQEKTKDSEKTIIDLFKQQVKHSSDEIALVVEKSTYTYKKYSTYKVQRKSRLYLPTLPQTTPGSCCPPSPTSWNLTVRS